MNTASVNRMCSECLTDNCFYPLVDGCQSCRQARNQFMDSVAYSEEVASDKGTKTQITTPKMIFQQTIQPWKSLVNFLVLN